MEHINRSMNEYIEELKQKDKKVLSTGFEYIDNSIKGLNAGELIVIASRPQMGKTTLLLNIAKNVVMNEQVSVAIFSLEMSKQRFIESLNISDSSIIRNIDIDSKTSNEDLEDIEKLADRFSEVKIFIDDTPSLKVQEIEDKCIKLKETEGLELVVIDYLQLIQNEECEDDICIELKKMSQRLDVTIIVTSQLSRMPMERFEADNDPTPVISDISSNISRIADVLLFIHRDDYYYENSEKPNVADIIIAKNKFGDTGTIELLFDKMSLRYVNFEEK